MNSRKIFAFLAASLAASTFSAHLLVFAVVIGIALAAFVAVAQASGPPAPISLSKLETTYTQLKVQRVHYGYGVKAENYSPNGSLSLVNVSKIRAIDCSGLVRFGAYVTTAGALVMPDGSQMQREWAENVGLHHVKSYADAARYMTSKRLFICFIKPWTNGCGSVGHVWFLRQRDGKPMTVESHGGVGVNSRPWDAPTLKREVYSVYELPATA